MENDLAQCTPLFGAFEGHLRALERSRRKTHLPGRRKRNGASGWNNILIFELKLIYITNAWGDLLYLQVRFRNEMALFCNDLVKIDELMNFVTVKNVLIE
jgi:hypothetical protein